jgi:hypothetical protein
MQTVELFGCDEDSGRFAVLGNNDRSLGFAELTQDLRSLRFELSDRKNIFGYL